MLWHSSKGMFDKARLLNLIDDQAPGASTAHNSSKKECERPWCCYPRTANDGLHLSNHRARKGGQHKLGSSSIIVYTLVVGILLHPKPRLNPLSYSTACDKQRRSGWLLHLNGSKVPPSRFTGRHDVQQGLIFFYLKHGFYGVVERSWLSSWLCGRVTTPHMHHTLGAKCMGVLFTGV